MRKIPWFWKLSLSLNLFLIFFIIGTTIFVVDRWGVNFILWRLDSRKIGVFPPDYPKKPYLNRISHFESLPDEEGEIIFFGDSITDGAEWHELFGTASIKNRGIGGDMSGNLLWRIDEVIHRKPRKLFIMIGTNDLAYHTGKPALMTNYEEIIQRIRSASPETEIYIQSLLPVWGKWTWHRDNPHIREANRRLVLLAKKYHCTYVDLFSSFVAENGELKTELSFDGLHLSGKGYLLWKEKIEPYVKD